MKQLLTLLKDARLNQISKEEEFDFIKLYQLSMQHQIIPLIYNQIYSFSLPNDLKNHWKKQTVQMSVLQTMKTEKFLSLYKEFINNDLKVIVVKGLICRSLYPHPDYRTSNDEDLYVKQDEFSKTKEILLNNGLKIVNESIDVTTFADSSSGLSIELHTSLFDEESKAYGSYQQYFDHAFDSIITHQIMNTNIYSLNYNDHYLFLITHFVKHFLHGGVGLRQIVDIIMYAEKYHEYIDFNYIYQVLKDLNIYNLMMNIYAIAHDYLSLDLHIVNLLDDYDEQITTYDDLLEDIIDAGIFGKSTNERLHSSTMTLNALSSGKTSIIKSLFPDYKAMCGKYEYLVKYPLLLPIAYISRILTYITNKQNDSAKTIEIGNHRIELLKKYKMIK